jgi:hypothetical protein
MSKHPSDVQTLTQYLLGSLPAAEAERLDELSVTDDEVAEALKSVEKDLIDAYVQDELDEAALARFKTYYLASATRSERVAFAQAFHARAEKSLTSRAAVARAEAPTGARTEAATKAARGRKGRGMFSVRRGPDVSRPAWQWGAACAALALLVAVGWLTFDNVRLRQRLAQVEARRDAPEQRARELQNDSASQRAPSTQPADESAHAGPEPSAQEQKQPDNQQLGVERQHGTEQQQQRASGQQSSSTGAGSIASFILAPQTRGASQRPTVSLPTNADRVAMRLRLEPNEFTTYRVTLLDETGSQILWRSRPLKARAGADGKILSLNFRASLLKPRTGYVLRATSDAGEIVDDYPFRVVK